MSTLPPSGQLQELQGVHDETLLTRRRRGATRHRRPTVRAAPLRVRARPASQAIGERSSITASTTGTRSVGAGFDGEPGVSQQRDGEEVLDQLELALGVAPHDLEQARGLAAEGRLPHVDEDLGVAEDRGERRPQLVRHGRDQLIADPLARRRAAPAAAEGRSRRGRSGRRPAGYGTPRREVAAVTAYADVGGGPALMDGRGPGQQVADDEAAQLGGGCRAEQPLRARVRQRDDAGRVDHDQGVTRCVDDPAQNAASCSAGG